MDAGKVKTVTDAAALLLIQVSEYAATLPDKRNGGPDPATRDALAEAVRKRFEAYSKGVTYP